LESGGSVAALALDSGLSEREKPRGSPAEASPSRGSPIETHLAGYLCLSPLNESVSESRPGDRNDDFRPLRPSLAGARSEAASRSCLPSTPRVTPSGDGKVRRHGGEVNSKRFRDFAPEACVSRTLWTTRTEARAQRPEARGQNDALIGPSLRWCDREAGVGSRESGIGRRESDDGPKGP
jgi:hypothetical protein